MNIQESPLLSIIGGQNHTDAEDHQLTWITKDCGTKGDAPISSRSGALCHVLIFTLKKQGWTVMEYEGSRGKWTSTLSHTTINGQKVWGCVQEVFIQNVQGLERALSGTETHLWQQKLKFYLQKPPQRKPKYNVVEGKEFLRNYFPVASTREKKAR